MQHKPYGGIGPISRSWLSSLAEKRIGALEDMERAIQTKDLELALSPYEPDAVVTGRCGLDSKPLRYSIAGGDVAPTGRV